MRRLIQQRELTGLARSRFGLRQAQPERELPFAVSLSNRRTEFVGCRRRDRRSAALLLAVLLCAGQLAGLVHSLVVRHVRCAEHGEMVHSGEGAQLLSVAGIPEGASYAASAGSPSGEAHDHCAFWVHPREQSSLRSAHCPVAPPFSAQPSGSEHRAATGPQVELLHLAPKSSPPV